MTYHLTREHRHAALLIDRECAIAALKAAESRRDMRAVREAQSRVDAATARLVAFENFARAA